MRINTNITALNTFNSYTAANNKIAGSVAKLSSGYAINSAADNAAGLAISEKMRAQIRGLDTASENSQSAISLVQTAEGALESSDEILQRMREIAVQSSSDTNEDSIDREALQAEFSQLQSELDDIATDTTYNNQNLLNGDLSTKKLSTGSHTSLSGTGMTVSFGNATAGEYNFSVGVKVTTTAAAAVKPNTATVNSSSLNAAFTNATATLDSNVAASTLLNGDYTISATADTDADTVTVTATNSSNGKTYTKTLTSSDLASKSAGSTISIDFGGDNADAFKLNLTVGSTALTGATPSDAELQTLAEDLTGTALTVSGGKDAVEQQSKVVASMTGADDITLQAGDTSATFSNGITVNFNKLSAADVDTTATYTSNDGAIDATGSAFASGVVTPGDRATTDTLTSASKSYSLSATSSGDTVTLIATGTNGDTYTASYATTGTLTDYDAASALTFNFKDSSGNTAFSTALTVGGTAVTTSTDKAVEASDLAATLNAMADGALTFSSSTAQNAAVAGANGTGFGVTAIDTATSVVATVSTDTSLAKTIVSGSYTIESASFDAGTGKITALARGTNGDVFLGSGTANLTNGGVTTLDFGAFSIAATNDGAAAITGANIAADLRNTGNALTFTGQGTITVSDAVNYNFESVFGKTAVTTAGSDTGKSASTVQVNSESNDGLTIQVGANSGDDLEINLDRADAEYLGVKGLDVSTQDSAATAIDAVNKAINQVSSQRAYLGAIENRLDYKISNLETSSENLTSAESSIRDVDMAKEMTSFTNANILSQAATAMLAQANSLPQNVLSLLG